MAAKKAKKKKKVKLTMDLPTLERVIDAMNLLGAPGFCFERFVDDPAQARKLKKRGKKKKK